MSSKKINEDLENMLLDKDKYPAPNAFCFDKNKVRAFVLGADPSNFSDRGKTKRIDTVFGLGSGEARYFQGPYENLKRLGLGLEDIYVQNIIKHYCSKVTTENKNWKQLAELYIEDLRKELNSIDKSRKVPALLTAGICYEVLIIGKCHQPKEFYNCRTAIPVPAKENRLGRPLIPFYRSIAYDLKKPEWSEYVKTIKLQGGFI